MNTYTVVYLKDDSRHTFQAASESDARWAAEQHAYAAGCTVALYEADTLLSRHAPDGWSNARERGETIAERLEYLRGELRAERISYGELEELQELAAHIAADDVELLEAAGVPEFPDA